MTQAPKILVVEDDEDLSALLCVALTELPAIVFHARDGEQAIERIKADDLDLLLLDLRLPKLGGLDVCKRLRSNGSQLPIMMLTAKASELDQVLGLELGADDYVTKPFGMHQLLARVKAMLRRSTYGATAKQGREIVQIGALILDRTAHKARIGSVALELTPKEWDLLSILAANPGRIYSRSELLDLLWGRHHEGFDHTVNSHINRLRGKLILAGSSAPSIRTIWGAGYRLESAST